ncbi:MULTISPECIES: hypothetical protein [unclassified Amycolatopsis]|uniref:hypothetical protein n=1 Tax=unclassified Amycolatopsis TaxID=2618356 RepID=UPI002E216F5F|nr:MULTISPECIES: hypothetical protein [unclassified Amycolatopsis]
MCAVEVDGERQFGDELLALQATCFDARQARRSAEAIDVIDDVAVVRQLLADKYGTSSPRPGLHRGDAPEVMTCGRR